MKNQAVCLRDPVTKLCKVARTCELQGPSPPLSRVGGALRLWGDRQGVLKPGALVSLFKAP